MTARSYTNGDEIPSQPAVRSAWDAVKGEVTKLAVFTGIVGFDVICSALNGSAGNTFGMAAGIVGGVCFGALALAKAARTISVLKGISAPRL